MWLTTAGHAALTPHSGLRREHGLGGVAHDGLLQGLAGLLDVQQGGAHEDAGPAYEVAPALRLHLVQPRVHLVQRQGRVRRNVRAVQGRLHLLQTYNGYLRALLQSIEVLRS